MSLEQRVARLERGLDELAAARAPKPQTPTRDWRSTVGMFRDDPIMKEIIDAALRQREEERRLAHEEGLRS